MRIIQHTINIGVNNIPSTKMIDRVEFETNAKKYSLTVNGTLSNTLTPDNFSGESTEILSDCFGVLTIYTPDQQEIDPVLSEIEKIKKERRRKHYNKFFNWDQGVCITTHENLKAFQYHLVDFTKYKAVESCINGEFLQTTEINFIKETFLNRFCMITDVIVTAQQPCQMKLLSGELELELANVAILPGTATYPLVIPLYAALYNHLKLSFTETVDVRLKFFVIPTDFYKELLNVYIPDYDGRFERGCCYNSRNDIWTYLDRVAKRNNITV